VVGDDFRFGHQRSGSITDIDRFGQSMGLTVEQSQTCLWEDVRVSSTRIREALSAGELPDVHKMLGRPFEMAGKVVYGDQLGRTIGFPTANLKISQPSLPCRGVYAVSVTGAGLENQNAVANLGVRPTLDGVNSRCEVHILGQAMAQLANQGHSLYGERLRIRFEQKLRDEQRFESVSALKSAIEKDITAAKRFFDASGEE
jgi:riboflavin kinase/FMN adenylyltransferase